MNKHLSITNKGSVEKHNVNNWKNREYWMMCICLLFTEYKHRNEAERVNVEFRLYGWWLLVRLLWYKISYITTTLAILPRSSVFDVTNQNNIDNSSYCKTTSQYLSIVGVRAISRHSQYNRGLDTGMGCISQYHIYHHSTYRYN